MSSLSCSAYISLNKAVWHPLYRGPTMQESDNLVLSWTRASMLSLWSVLSPLVNANSVGSTMLCRAIICLNCLNSTKSSLIKLSGMEYSGKEAVAVASAVALKPAAAVRNMHS